jgi:hypothetical protein
MFIGIKSLLELFCCFARTAYLARAQRPLFVVACAVSRLLFV